jgi:type IV secretion system protein VirB2
MLALLPEAAHAVDTPMGKTMCTVVTWMSGNLGKGLETIVIAALGIGAMLGKISWGTAILEGVGCAIVFGAAQIVNAMNAGAGGTCSTT